MASRKKQPTTDTSSASAITLCSASTSLETVQGLCSDQATSTAPMAGRLLFRADAAFAKPEMYEYLESKSIGYAIRLPANEVLQREIAHLLVWPTRPRVGGSLGEW